MIYARPFPEIRGPANRPAASHHVRRANPPPEPVHRASRPEPMFEVHGMGRLSHTDYLLGNQCLGDDRRRGRPSTDVRECERAQVTPLRRRTATALPPGRPSWLPSISRPKLSWRPVGETPSTRSWTGLVSLNGFLGTSVTSASAGVYLAVFSGITLEFLAVKEPPLPAVARR